MKFASQTASDGWSLKFCTEIVALRQRRDTQLPTYRSAIAFKLSPYFALDARKLARTIADLVCQEIATSAQPLDSWLSDLSVRVQEPGWIDFEIGPRSLARCLQQWVSTPLPSALYSADALTSLTVEKIESWQAKPSALFACQHIHSRCCSLLKLSHQEGLIALSHLTDPVAHWRIVRPAPLPWLTEAQQLNLTHSTERQLIHQLILIMDGWCAPGLTTQPPSACKAAIALTQAFQSFYQACRIWGEACVTSLYLTQGRLGLVMITQRLLEGLLRARLNVAAPVEL